MASDVVEQDGCCPNGHALQRTTLAELSQKPHSPYSGGVKCDQCDATFSGEATICHCEICHYDVCQPCLRRIKKGESLTREEFKKYNKRIKQTKNLLNFKVVLYGEDGVGKSSLLIRLTTNEFDDSGYGNLMMGDIQLPV